MPYSIYFASDGAEIRFTGPLTAQDIHPAIRVALHAEYPAGLQWQFLDFSGTAEVGLSTRDLQVFAEKVKEHARGHSKFAIAIVAPTPLLFGLSRMLETYMEGAIGESAIMNAREDGLAWIKGLSSRKRVSPSSIERNVAQ